MKREFMLGSVPVVIYGEESARVFLFVHGLHGCKEEAARFAAVAVPRGWQVLAMDLPEHGGRKDGKRLVPWDVIPELQSVLRYAGGRYATIAVHATSIGAWFSMHAFADARIEKSLFVSPLVDMPAMIRGMMVAAGVDRARQTGKGDSNRFRTNALVGLSLFCRGASGTRVLPRYRRSVRRGGHDGAACDDRPLCRGQRMSAHGPAGR